MYMGASGRSGQAVNTWEHDITFARAGTYYVWGYSYFAAGATIAISGANSGNISATSMTNSGYRLDSTIGVSASQTVSIDITSGGERIFFGFVAQEIKETYPHMVFENNDGMYSLDYTQFIPISIKNLQDQAKSITKLQNRIKTMKEKLKKLKHFTDLEYLPLSAFSTDKSE